PPDVEAFGPQRLDHADHTTRIFLLIGDEDVSHFPSRGAILAHVPEFRKGHAPRNRHRPAGRPDGETIRRWRSPALGKEPLLPEGSGHPASSPSALKTAVAFADFRKSIRLLAAAASLAPFGTAVTKVVKFWISAGTVPRPSTLGSATTSVICEKESS